MESNLTLVNPRDMTLLPFTVGSFFVEWIDGGVELVELPRHADLLNNAKCWSCHATTAPEITSKNFILPLAEDWCPIEFFEEIHIRSAATRHESIEVLMSNGVSTDAELLWALFKRATFRPALTTMEMVHHIRNLCNERNGIKTVAFRLVGPLVEKTHLISVL